VATLTFLILRCSSSIAMLSAPFAVGDSSFSVNSQGYRGKARASTTAWATSRQRRKSALGWPILALRVTAVLEAQRESEEMLLPDRIVEVHRTCSG
jgi:hypothetical protein